MVCMQVYLADMGGAVGDGTEVVEFSSMPRMAVNLVLVLEGKGAPESGRFNECKRLLTRSFFSLKNENESRYNACFRYIKEEIDKRVDLEAFSV